MIKLSYQLGILYALEKLGALSPEWAERIRQIEAQGGAAGHGTFAGFGAAQRAQAAPSFAQTHAPMLPRQQATQQMLERVPLIGGKGEWYTGQGHGTPQAMHTEVADPKQLEALKQKAKVQASARSARMEHDLARRGNIFQATPEARAALAGTQPVGTATGVPKQVGTSAGTHAGKPSALARQAARSAVGLEPTMAAATSPMAFERTMAHTPVPRAVPKGGTGTWLGRLASKVRPAARALRLA